MLLQISLQCWMVLYELLIFYQGRILAKLLGGFPVVVQELVETGQLSASGVTVATATGILAPVEASFLAHESVGIFRYLLAYPLMLLQISLQLGMVFYELLILYQGRILAYLLGGFPVV